MKKVVAEEQSYEIHKTKENNRQKKRLETANETTATQNISVSLTKKSARDYASKCVRPLFSKMNLPTSANRSDPFLSDVGEAKEANGSGRIMWMERVSVCHRKGIVDLVSNSDRTNPGSQGGWHIPL